MVHRLAMASKVFGRIGLEFLQTGNGTEVVSCATMLVGTLGIGGINRHAANRIDGLRLRSELQFHLRSGKRVNNGTTALLYGAVPITQGP